MRGSCQVGVDVQAKCQIQSLSTECGTKPKPKESANLLSQSQTAVKPKPKLLPDYFRHSVETVMSDIHKLTRFETTNLRSVQFDRLSKTIFDPCSNINHVLFKQRDHNRIPPPL